jgi:hypothetical protein
MSDRTKPNFHYWEHATLAKLAGEQFDQIIQLRQALEQLRLDLKDAMKLLREANK